MFFNSWESLLRIAVVGVLAYLGLVVMLRVSEKRTLSKMNAFDLVVTVALGSTLATVLLSKSVALLDGLLAFAVLILMQAVITWLSVRSRAVQRFVKAEPSLLLHRGQFLEKTMRDQRVTEPEVLAALRSQGVASVENAEAVVLETDGSFSIIQRQGESSYSTLSNVHNSKA